MSKIIFIVTVTLTFDPMTPKINRILPLQQGNHVAKFGKYLIYRNKVIVWTPSLPPARRPPAIPNHIIRPVSRRAYKKYKRTNNDLQNIHKTKDRLTRSSLKNGGELMCSGRVNSFCSTSSTRCVNLATNLVTIHELGKDQEDHLEGFIKHKNF